MSSRPGRRLSWIQPWKTGMKPASCTAAGSSAKSLTLSCWASTSSPCSGRGLPVLDLVVAGVRGLDEELRLLDLLVGPLGVRALRRGLVRAQEERGEARSGSRVEQLRVVETSPELGHDLVRLFADVGVLDPDQRLGRAQHRAVGQVRGAAGI